MSRCRRRSMIICRCKMIDYKLTPQMVFRAAQGPGSWLLSAENLQEAAEAIIEREDSSLIAYLRAHDAATEEAMAIAYSPGNDAGHAEINARAPNYPPAQMLYAFAIENLLKGLIVANDPAVISSDKLSNALKSHDLIELADTARFAVHIQEAPVLKALSELAVWAGRYPVAIYAHDFAVTPNPDELMDYGSRNPIMRAFFRRAYQTLESRLPKPIGPRSGAVVVFRQPGT
jgi:hypothetical protein